LTIFSTIVRRKSPVRDRLPDFLCIGAQRAGTTQLHNALLGHPQLYLPPAKELHALDTMAGLDPERWNMFRRNFLDLTMRRRWRAGLRGGTSFAWARRFALHEPLDMAWYASLFRDAQDDQLAGEFTPSYALLPPGAIAEAVKHMPKLRVFFILRDPIERALSGAIHACTLAIGKSRRPDMDELIAALRHPGCIGRSRYRTTIENWTAHVARSHFHVLLFDDLLSNPDRLLAQVHQTLGITSRSLPRGLSKRTNANSVRIEWPRNVLRELAVQLNGDCAWLAERYGGVTRRWAEKTDSLSRS
jgi:hypothetical protein